MSQAFVSVGNDLPETTQSTQLTQQDRRDYTDILATVAPSTQQSHKIISSKQNKQTKYKTIENFTKIIFIWLLCFQLLLLCFV
jgi:hypothetical protein